MGHQYILGGLLALTITLSASANEVERPDSAAAVKVAAVEYLPTTSRVSTYGTLAPKTEELSFKVGGRIAAFSVEEGAEVSVGQLLAKLETKDAEDALDRQRVELEQAQRAYQRMGTLHTKGSIQRSQLEDADARLEQVRIAHEQAELQLDRCYLRASSDGLILKEFLDSRTTITAGQGIFSFQRNSEEWVTKVDLTDRNAFALGEGASAVIRFAPYPGVSFDGELTKLARVANPGDALYTAEVTISTANYALRPGMVAEVDLYRVSGETFATIPFDAIVNLRGTQGTIYLPDANSGTAIEKKITVQAIQGDKVAIRQNLAPYTQIVTRGQGKLADGTHIRIVE